MKKHATTFCSFLMLSLLFACSKKADQEISKSPSPVSSAASDRKKIQPVVTEKGALSMEVNGKLDASGKVVLQAGDLSVSIHAPDRKQWSDKLWQCTDKVELVIKTVASEQKLELESLFFDEEGSLYRGGIGDDYKMRGHSVVISDVNADGMEDLLVWTGKEGSYGGPSFDVYLMDSASGMYKHSQPFTELSIGTSGLFVVEPSGKIRTWASHGVYGGTTETYEVRNNIPVLIERLSEEINEQGKAKLKKEILVNGKLKEVPMK